MGKTSSQDQCASSDSLHDEGYGKRGNDMKPAPFMCNPSFSINTSQTEINQPMIQVPYAYADPCLGGIFTPYGPHTIIQPQVMGAASSRVPLPVNLPEDGPIYVNAKQYHGILRRRQIRAKLEAQNKLVKMRKPYLHESRHVHALNRVRGSGGRFLSTKKLQQSSSHSRSPVSSQITRDSLHFNQNEGVLDKDAFRFDGNRRKAPSIAQDMSSTSSGTIFQHAAESRFSSIPHHMPASMHDNGGLVYNGNRHYASIVR